jgi:hypothetical protein
VAERFDAIYCSPSISSGISFQRWRPAAVIAYAGGRVAPEHAAQALGRVRCPDVPAWIYAPERCPGAALRVGSGSTDPAQLIADLRAVADPLLGQLQDAGDAWLGAWALLGLWTGVLEEFFFGRRFRALIIPLQFLGKVLLVSLLTIAIIALAFFLNSDRFVFLSADEPYRVYDIFGMTQFYRLVLRVVVVTSIALLVVPPCLGLVLEQLVFQTASATAKAL